VTKSGAERIDLARLFVLAVKWTAGIVALVVLTPWLIVLTPRWVFHSASLAFLWSLLALSVLAIPAVLVGGAWSIWAAIRASRRGDIAARTRHLRRVLLASSCFVSLIAMEMVSQIVLRWSLRLPALPTRFAKSAKHGSPSGSVPQENDGLYIVVIGESSARGEPYHPWLSVGQLIGWQLEQVFPGRPVDVDVRADGGYVLEQAVLPLCELEQRPDAIIVFAGHNEFQTRFGWSRDVRHYVEEGPKQSLALLDWVRSTSSTAKLTLKTLDRYYGESAPRSVTRALVDHPICAPKETAFLLEDFRVRLDAVTEYCTRIGSLPILIMPGSNDGSFEPNRSVLAGSTPAATREAFDREFRAIEAAEPNDKQAAIAGYRRLIERHPEFAETHYRIARLLAATGSWAEAKQHFVLARDLDGFPLRCPTDFRAAYRSVARRYDAVLVDGPDVLARISPHGILDDHLFHDAHHLNLAGIVALANDALKQLQRRRAFGWPASVPAPRVELEACARHFKLDGSKWAEVCKHSAGFYARTAYVRFDPSTRLRVADQYGNAAADFAGGLAVRTSDLPTIKMAASLLARHDADVPTDSRSSGGRPPQ
jgi:hypothetical protein